MKRAPVLSHATDLCPAPSLFHDSALDRSPLFSNPWAVAASTLANGGIAILAILLGLHTATQSSPAALPHSSIDLGNIPLFSIDSRANHGGPGGGSNDPIDPIQGRAPRLEATPLAPPTIPVVDDPRLAVDSAIASRNLRLPDNATMPNIGVLNSPNVALDSGGPGSRSGIGTGDDGGVGPGNGPGYGLNPGTGDAVYPPGRGIVAPVPIYTPEAEFSDEARHQKYQGICLIALIVDAHGNPRNIHLVQHLGMGLDEKALDAVRRYRFRPGTKDGKPVAVFVTVEVDFRLF